MQRTRFIFATVAAAGLLALAGCFFYDFEPPLHDIVIDEGCDVIGDEEPAGFEACGPGLADCQNMTWCYRAPDAESVGLCLPWNASFDCAPDEGPLDTSPVFGLGAPLCVREDHAAYVCCVYPQWFDCPPA